MTLWRVLCDTNGGASILIVQPTENVLQVSSRHRRNLKLVDL
jgi:hypothetical protein